MKSRSKRFAERNETRVERALNMDSRNDPQVKHGSIRPIQSLTQSQAIHINALYHNEVVVAIGPAGTGKTYLSAAVAAELMKNGLVKRIILTRPNVEVGEKMGYLPGEIDDKYEPYLKPFKKGIIERIGTTSFTSGIKNNIIPSPLAYMRGETFDDAVMLLDEAQNVTEEQMKMFLTRAGTNCRIFISGDVEQCDIPKNKSGLAWLIREVNRQNTCISLISYDRTESVRSELCKEMLEMIANAA